MFSQLFALCGVKFVTWLLQLCEHVVLFTSHCTEGLQSDRMRKLCSQQALEYS